MHIEWTEKTVALKDLIPYGGNPRRVTKIQFEALVKNIEANGYTNRIIVNQDNIVLAGNQRLKALKKLKYELVTVLKPSIHLTKEQEQRINVTDNISAGEWNTDMLANLFDAEVLYDWGMPKNYFEADDEPTEPKEKKTKTCPHCGEVL